MTSTMIKRFVSCACVALLFSGCVTSQEGKQLQADIDALKAQQDVMTKTLETREANMAEMIAQARKENEALRESIKQAQAMLAKNDAETGVDLQQMRKELDRLRGQAEEAEFKLAKMEQDMKLFKEDVDLRIAGAQQEALPENATELLDLGRSRLAAGEWRDSRKALEAFASRHSQDTRVDEVIFLIGETYYNEKQYISAIYEYQKIIKNYDRSKHLPSAALRIGQAFKELGRCEQSKPFFETVVSEYKRSDAAKEAKAELDKGCVK